jgi:hypothetical protein
MAQSCDLKICDNLDKNIYLYFLDETAKAVSFVDKEKCKASIY